MSYCLLADLKTYLGISSVSGDDALLQVMLDASTARIDSRTGRVFFAAADATLYFDPVSDVYNGLLWLNTDLSYITSVLNGDSSKTNITDSIYTKPANQPAYYALGLLPSSSDSWQYSADSQNSLSVTGRWAYMDRAAITLISRSSNIVTATVYAPQISVGMQVAVVGIADANFNGTFTVTGNNGTQVTWAQTAGDDTDTTGVLLFAPVDIVTACRRLAAWMYRQKDTQQGDLDRPVLMGDGTVIMPTTLPIDVEELIRPYVRVIN